MRVLIVVAHPDDAEIAMGMRMRWHADRGDEVTVYSVSAGLGDASEQQGRMAEARTAGEILGVKSYQFGSVQDTRFADSRGRINGDLYELFSWCLPDVVYTHFPVDQHADHMVTGEEVRVVALRESRDLVYFRSLYSESFSPNLVFMAPDELASTKKAALACFASQTQIPMDHVMGFSSGMHRQYVHHRVVDRFPEGARHCELFRVDRRIEIA